MKILKSLTKELNNLSHYLNYMKLYLIFILLSFNVQSIAQKKYLNSDGNISLEDKRELFIKTFNDNEKGGQKFTLEKNDFVIISKYDCIDNNLNNTEIQKRAIVASFNLLLEQIHGLQEMGFETLQGLEFDGVIFKNNYICALTTRRYHFRFSLNELKSFPEFIDLEELYQYIVVTNQNKNIVYVKNDK